MVEVPIFLKSANDGTSDKGRSLWTRGPKNESIREVRLNSGSKWYAYQSRCEDLVSQGALKTSWSAKAGSAAPATSLKQAPS